MTIPLYTGTEPDMGSSTFDADIKSWIDWLLNKAVPGYNTTAPSFNVVFIDDGDSPYSATAGEEIHANTTVGTIIINMPAAPGAATQIKIVDSRGTFATNNVTVGRNTKKIETAESDYTLSTNGEECMLTYTDSAAYGWEAKERS